MSQWSEIRQLTAEGVPKREVARRLNLNVKTVRRALRQEEAPFRRKSARRGRRLERWRPEIEDLLRRDRRLTAKRIADLLRDRGVAASVRSWREYVAEVRAALFPKEAFVDRSPTSGDAAEFDFGDTAAMVGGRLMRLKFLVATLPYSNAYFAKAYPAERLECLLDGIAAAFAYFGGVPTRIVLDNTGLAVREVLRGRERIEQRAFEAFRGQWPTAVDYCAPRKGWEKGSVEGGVGYVRDNVFRPMPEVADFAELNARITAALERGMDERRTGGRTVREALAEERGRLRPLPAHPPETCRTSARVVDKFGYVRIDGATYSAPIALAHRPVTCKAFHDRIEIAHEDRVAATHARSYVAGTKVIEPRHVLSLLEKKHRAVPEAEALRHWRLPTVFYELREDLRGRVKKPDREWVGVLRLLETHAVEEVEAAVVAARDRGSPRLETVRSLLRREASASTVEPVALTRADLAVDLRAPDLGAYDLLHGAAS